MAKLILLMVITVAFSLSLESQCLDELTHNTSSHDGWISCQRSMNPLTEFGQSHWILYEFDAPQSIEKIRIWNLNHTDNLSSGIKRMRMDISPDGGTWTNMGILELETGIGANDYTGQEFEDMGVFETRFVLFSMLENHGGPCYGLSEVQFSLGENTVAAEDEYLSSLVTVSPNPVDQQLNIILSDIETRKITYQLVDMSGKVLLRGNSDTNGLENTLTFDASSLPDGQYAIKLDTDQGAIAKKIIVTHPK